MIATIDIEVNAANPNKPLRPLTAHVGSPSQIRIRNVPRAIGAWRIDAVQVTANYPDNRSVSKGCVLVGGMWCATLDGSGVAGVGVRGYQITADGTDENGARVTGYVLGVGDVVIIDRDGTIHVGETSYYVHLTEAESETPRIGDLALSSMRLWDGSSWRALGGGGGGGGVQSVNSQQPDAHGNVELTADDVLTDAQLAAANSGITSDLVPKVLTIDESTATMRIMLNGVAFTSFSALTALVQKGVTRLRYYVTNAASRPVLYTAHLCDSNAIRFDATGTLGETIYTRSIAVTRSGEDGIAVSVGTLTEIAKASDLAGKLDIFAPTVKEVVNVSSDFSVSPPIIRFIDADPTETEWGEDTIELMPDRGEEQHPTGKNFTLILPYKDGTLAIRSDIAAATKLTPVYGEWKIEGATELDIIRNASVVFEDSEHIEVSGDYHSGERWEHLDHYGCTYTDPETPTEAISGPFKCTRAIVGYTTAKGEELMAGSAAAKTALFAGEAFKQAVSGLLKPGDNVTIAKNPTTGEITISATGGGGDSKPKIASFEQLKAYIDAKVADASFANDAERIAKMKSDLVGVEIEDTWANTGGTIYFDPMIIVNVGKWKGEDGEMHIGAMVMHKYATTETVVFDMANKEVASESTAQDGVYYYGLALGETTVTAAKLTLLDLAVGDALPKSEYETIYKSAIRDTSRNILQYGHNNWRDSAYRQWLNSNVAKGTSWWTKPYTGKATPGNATTIRGYVQGCSGFNGLNADGTPRVYTNGILKFAKPVYITTSPNYICDGGNNSDPSVGAYETLDLFFLPSGAEMFGNVNTTGSGEAMVSYEGEFSPYWKEATGFVAPNTTYSAARSIFTENGQSSASFVRLRSATRGSSCYVWLVNTSGGLNNHAASNAYAAVPACVIY